MLTNADGGAPSSLKRPQASWAMWLSSSMRIDAQLVAASEPGSGSSSDMRSLPLGKASPVNEKTW